MRGAEADNESGEPVLRGLRPRTERSGKFAVWRYLAFESYTIVGPFVLIEQGGSTSDDLRPPRELPYAGISAVQYSLAGSVRYRDSAGHAAGIHTGDLAITHAGRGVTVQEQAEPLPNGLSIEAHFLRAWLALPDRVENTIPAFELYRASSLPELNVPGGRVRVLLGEGFGCASPASWYQPVLIADVQVNAGGTLPIAPDYPERAIALLDGDVRLDGRTLKARRLHVLRPEARLDLTSESGCRVALFAGHAFPSPRFIAGGIVASSNAQLDRIYRNYTSGRFPRIEIE
ncbi:MAG: pirin-like C-terminal cupin domain-containing protein [Myxococcota bacterium]